MASFSPRTHAAEPIARPPTSRFSAFGRDHREPSRDAWPADPPAPRRCSVSNRLLPRHPHRVGLPLLMPSLRVRRRSGRCPASRSMAPRICPKRGRVKRLSANCRTKNRACRTRRPPVLKSRCWRLVRDQLWMARGRVSLRSRFPRLYAMTAKSNRTSLARKR